MMPAQDGPSALAQPARPNRSRLRATILRMKHAYSRQARERRAAIFRRLFPDAMNRSILDLGGGDGTHIASVVPGHTNVTIAEIDRRKLAYAEAKFGHKGRVLSESPQLPFEDGEFDIVFCSSVIEHVTGPKDEVGNIRSTAVFEAQAALHQRRFAEEVRRIGRGYFVQTPYKHFPIESHTLAPGPVVLLPRSVQLELWKWWPFYSHVPDFNLLTVRDMQLCFPDAEIHRESAFGLTKSIMAVRRI
jgi:SAM-dependent methyltransferase